MSAAQTRKKLSDLLGEEEDLEVPFGAEKTGESGLSESERETPEAGGSSASTREGENGRDDQLEGREEADESDRTARDRTASARNRGKVDTSRGAARGRARQAPGRAVVELSKAERDDWRWRLRSLAGKLYADQQALYETEGRWEKLVAQARENGVPEHMLQVALMDAGVHEHDQYL
ncbi:hypothetical protein [Nonomuraea sp. NPDC005650]|uniref:hypothetical protein n=1 Tax=Nonomuraea sp. NPDC005650 TaxID=3157045 RepID=UPI0033A82E32